MALLAVFPTRVSKFIYFLTVCLIINLIFMFLSLSMEVSRGGLHSTLALLKYHPMLGHPIPSIHLICTVIFPVWTWGYFEFSVFSIPKHGVCHTSDWIGTDQWKALDSNLLCLISIFFSPTSSDANFSYLGTPHAVQHRGKESPKSAIFNKK